MHMYMRMEFLTKEGLSANRRVVIVRIRKLTEGRPKIWLASFSRGFIRSYTVGEVYLSSHILRLSKLTFSVAFVGTEKSV